MKSYLERLIVYIAHIILTQQILFLDPQTEKFVNRYSRNALWRLQTPPCLHNTQSYGFFHQFEQQTGCYHLKQNWNRGDYNVRNVVYMSV